ncbi:hypothetical protein CXF68_01885 [Tenacibaculum sp. Bg11-29]|uniref:hypothetical protein n=1 Tax=Tenacibaculum sp. Bg11-29 TaxID=2058306 RepID=UPI000C32FA21|nr:hypothetical protein [Tenacibaculum sp. Bg11-29]PKH49513.1 hypothetical protein CXF68_01885 [Tenacibaculum sp. Bg11-29]
MIYNNDIRAEELRKLKNANYFDEETIKEIRADLDILSDEELEKNKIKIEKSTKLIIETISIDNYNCHKSGLAFN